MVEGIESKTGGDEGLSWAGGYYPVPDNMFRRAREPSAESPPLSSRDPAQKRC